MLFLPAQDRVAVPWKNGAGMTREVASGPDEASLSDFDWRVSLAEIRAEAPFSSFPGIDRIFTIVEGPGVTLTTEDGGMRDALPDCPISFPGESPIACRLYEEGTVTALNVMTRRGVATASVEVLPLPGWITGPHGVVIAIALRDPIAVAARVLAPWDGLVRMPEDGDVELSGVGLAAVVRIEMRVE